MSYAPQVARDLNLRPAQAASAIALLDEGNTVPFIARYRKETTGSLDEEQIRAIGQRLAALRALDERRAVVLNSIAGQQRLTPELQRRIASAQTMTELEDLYQPYKPKRRTRAGVAREQGLEPLARLILDQVQGSETVEELVRPFVNEQAPTVEAALSGARDIVAEAIADDAEVRGHTREKALRWGLLQCERLANAADERGVYKLYYDFEANVERLRPHQVLAINRGEAEKVLRVRLDIAERDWQLAVNAVYRPHFRSPLAGQLQEAISDAAQRLLLPAIERDVRRRLSEQAEQHAIAVFAENLRNLLLQPPLSGHTVMGIDPGYRTGCKLAVVDATGRVLATDSILPHAPHNRRREALARLTGLALRHHVSLIAIGNGTASRETEQLAAELIAQLHGPPHHLTCHYLIANEAGASVYSASPLARAELPDLDVTLRGAVSIARRVQDPLAELVKIDPRSIGVGLYQHDVNQKALAESLQWVVASVVNRVGVDVNTASPALLSHVSGIGPKLAANIVAHRDQHGSFRSRQELLQAQGMGPRTFEQAAGFLRIRDGANPLDTTAIHPESYTIAQALLRRAGLTGQEEPHEREAALNALHANVGLAALAAALGAGVPTLKDIFEQLMRPGRDPREDAPAPILRSDILQIEDLRPGMRLKGTVRNVVDFGAFIDIGLKNNGLLHRSQKPRHVELAVGDIVDVTILSVEAERGRISLGWTQAD